MSSYICENRTLLDEEHFEDINELYDYMHEHMNDELVFIEVCRECETEFNIDEYDRQM